MNFEYWKELGYKVTCHTDKLNGVMRHSAFRLFHLSEGGLALEFSHKFRCVSEHAEEKGNLVIHSRTHDNKEPYMYFLVKLPK